MFGCTKAYSRQDSLKNHVRKDHQLENATKLGRFVCSMVVLHTTMQRI